LTIEKLYKDGLSISAIFGIFGLDGNSSICTNSGAAKKNILNLHGCFSQQQILAENSPRSTPYVCYFFSFTKNGFLEAD
jgi:hypothetical protein